MLQDERSEERGRHLRVWFACAAFLRFALGRGRFLAQLLLDVWLGVLRDAAERTECTQADEEIDEQA